MEDFHEISDRTYLDDIRSGKITFIEVFCAGNKVEKNKALALAEAINANHAATAFDMGVDSQEPEAISTIFRALAQCPGLTSLYLNIKGKNTLNDVDVDALISIIRSCKSLSLLDMSDIHLLPEQQIKIIKSCAQSPSLEKLNFREWKINLIVIPALGELLEKSQTLKVLGLHNNNIGPNELSALLKYMVKNNKSPLEELKLSLNPIGSFGLITLATYIQSNKIKLKKLDLGSTDLNDTCADSLFAIVHCDSSLETFSCSTNELGDLALKRIAEAIIHNDHLIKFDLHGNNFHGDQQLAAVPNMSEVPHNSRQLLEAIELKLAENKRHQECDNGQSLSKL